MNINAENVIVADIMNKGVITIPEYATVKDSARLMSEKGISSLIVIKENEAVGIVTDRDIVKRVVATDKDPEMVLVREIMSSPITAIEPDKSLNDAAHIMIKNKVKKLPVVDDNNNLIGVLTYTDLLSSYPGYVDVLNELLRVRREDVNI